jgi:hypothetical protein
MSHEDLEQFAKRLAELRDNEMAAAKTFPGSADIWKARASGFKLALDALHTWSGGAYGEPYPFDEQEKGEYKAASSDTTTESEDR